MRWCDLVFFVNFVASFFVVTDQSWQQKPSDSHEPGAGNVWALGVGGWELAQLLRLTIHLPIARSRSSSMPASRNALSARSRQSAAMRRDVSRPYSAG